MASIRRTDIMHKGFSKGRPPKSEREKIIRRQEAYKWRDARRVYLANSFDKWRKLRSSLRLKDSSLAWHLMEAHEKGLCGICRQKNTDSTGKKKVIAKLDPKDFLPAMITSLKHLCQSHFEFDECIEVVGLICLEFDKKRKERFSLNEILKPKTKWEQQQNLAATCMEEKDIPVPSTSCVKTTKDVPSNSCSAVCSNADVEGNKSHPSHSDKGHPAEEGAATGLGSQDEEVCHKQSSCADDERAEGGTQTQDTAKVSESAGDPLKQNSTPDSDVKVSKVLSSVSVKKSEQTENCCPGPKDTNSSSDHDTSAEIDVEKLDTSQETNSVKEHVDNKLENKEIYSEHKNPCASSLPRGLTSFDVLVSAANNSQPHPIDSNPDITEISESASLSRLTSKLPVEADASLKMKPECQISAADEVDDFQQTDVPLDMSVVKTESHLDMDHVSPVDFKTHEQGNMPSNTAALPAKEKVSMAETHTTAHETSENLILKDFLPSKMSKKEDHHSSIPWQRRDMSRKEEYEFLELNPFSDLAEFSQRYPHVHQRTYYRWKRRIKEEYIILEQCPEMSFQQFSSIVLQAKESVFHLWKKMIAQGKGFFAPSDNSKRLEPKCSSSKSVTYFTEYAYLQKNLPATEEQFLQRFPGTTSEVFNLLKRRVVQEFWLFYQNQHMKHKEFSKLVNISEEVYVAWKEYIELLRLNTSAPDLKALMSSISPDTQHGTCYGTGKNSSAVDGLHSNTVDSVTSQMSMNSSLKDSIAPHINQLSSSIKDSVARNLSANYLASLQSMMMPWPNYYSLSQQMLPMMLWPGMMGLASGMTNHMGILGGSQLAAMRQTQVSSGLPGAFMGSPVPSSVEMKASKLTTNVEPEKTEETPGKSTSESLHNLKRTTWDRSQASSGASSPFENSKKLKLCQDKDDADSYGSLSRSRKQNKQEYIHYLKNPELGFKELETLFPSISLRTFYRWRKEMNAAVLFLEDNKDLTFQQFKLVFPDIPETVFESWKEKCAKGLPVAALQSTSVLPNRSEYKDEVAHFNSIGREEPLPKQYSPVNHLLGSRQNIRDADSNDFVPNNVEDATHIKKHSREEYLFVQKNPNIDFASFSRLFPNISVRSFYRWKKELKAAMDYLKANPSISYDAYKELDSSVSEEVFCEWKDLIKSKDRFSSDAINNVEEPEDTSYGQENGKQNAPEYWYLQLNPYIEFSQFSRTYPDVPQETFSKWKQEIHDIINYVRAQPNTEFSDIVSVMPHLSEDAFLKWKHLIEEEKSTEPLNRSKVGIDEEAKSQMTKALLHLMNNPTVNYSVFKRLFNFVSEETFQLWVSRIKTVVLFIVSDPTIDFPTFSTNIKDVEEEIFNKWKNLSPEEIAAMDLQHKDQQGLKSFSNFSSQPTSKNDHVQQGFEFCLDHPEVHFTVFHAKHPQISEETFNLWMTEISKELEYVKQNPSLSFEEFIKVYPNANKQNFDRFKSFSKPLEHFLKPPTENGDKSESTLCENKIVGATETGEMSIFYSGPDSHKEIDALFNKWDTKSKEDRIPSVHATKYQEVNPDKESEKCTKEDKSSFGVRLAPGILGSYSVQLSSIETEESSLSKLAKFADLSVATYSEDNSHNERSAFPSQLREGPRMPAHKRPEPQVSVETCTQNSHSPPPEIPSTLLNNNNFLNISNGEAAVKQEFYEQTSHGTDKSSNNLFAGRSESGTSLSALMAMSTSSQDSLKDEQGRYSIGSEKLSNSGLHSPYSSRWQGNLSNNSSNSCMKEEDEVFSSQRQKKMSRAEYMFVKDNPDVDSQEFSRIFPGVSARTFYRWKKEIKAQLQMA